MHLTSPQLAFGMSHGDGLEELDAIVKNCKKSHQRVLVSNVHREDCERLGYSDWIQFCDYNKFLRNNFVTDTVY